MHNLNSESLESITIKQLKEVMGMIPFYKREIEGCIVEHMRITDEYPEQAMELLAEYDMASNKIKQLIDSKYEAGGD